MVRGIALRGMSFQMRLALRANEQRGKTANDIHRPPLWSSGKSSWLQNGDVLYFL
jgi:hypothetical protein